MKIQMKGTTAEVLLYEDIGGWFGITADAFVKELKSIKASTINLRINSNGGNVFEGVAIYNYLRSHPARVEVDVDGIAASISSIIAMAGDEIRMADNAWMMIHDPWVMAVGTAPELRNLADTMDGIRDTLLDTYMKRATASREEVSDMMKAETWLKASDAAEVGLIDSVTEGMAIAASARSDWFKHIPETLPTHFQSRLEEKREKPAHAYVKQVLAKQAQSLRRNKI